MPFRIHRHCLSYLIQSKSTTDSLKIICFGLMLTALFALLLFSAPKAIEDLDHKSYDHMLQSLPAGNIHPAPVIVGIDDPSLEFHGQWPWPRHRLALLVKKIRELGAASIGLDIILAEPDRCSPPVILNELGPDFGFRITSHSVPYPDNDQILADTIAEAPVVLGHKFLFQLSADAPKKRWLHPLGVILRQHPSSTPLLVPEATDVICNLPIFSQAARGSGFINATADHDSVLRRLPLVIDYQGEWYPSLALACLIEATGQRDINVDVREGALLLTWAGREIPLNSSGEVLVRYRGPRKTFPFYSAMDILTDRIPAHGLKNKIVILGAWASGLGDWHASPMDSRFPGPEVHATVVDNILSGDFLHQPPWKTAAELLAVCIIGVSSSVVIAYTSASVCIAIICMTAVFLWMFFQWQFQSHGIYLSPVLPFITLFGNTAFLSIFKYGYAEIKIRKRTKDLFRAHDAIISSLAALAETRDTETGGHIFRTQYYVRVLAQRIARHPDYRRILDSETIDLLFKSAPLHDIGKVGIPDHILRKPESLTAEEIQQMKQHPIIGGKVLGTTAKMINPKSGLSYLQIAREMAESHHEKWDGTGYPHGLKGKAIPLAGRLMALADTYDAIISQRVYKPAVSHDRAKKIILANSGKQFDPDLVDAFIEEEHTFKRIAEQYQ